MRWMSSGYPPKMEKNCLKLFTIAILFAAFVILSVAVVDNTECTDAEGETFIVDDIKYQTISDHEVEVKANSYSGDITIPTNVTYEDTVYTVAAVGSDAFSGRSDLNSVTLPSSVTSIGHGAFYGCSNMTEITINGDISEIKPCAFFGCKSLTSIAITGSIQAINNYVFCGCESLTSVTLPDSVKYIESDAFANCSALTSFTVPTNVTSIGRTAFYYCSSLSTITFNEKLTLICEYAFQGTGITALNIPKNLTSIREGAFTLCDKIVSINVDSENKSYKSESDVLFSKDGKTLIRYPSGKTEETYNVPSSVTAIADRAFEYSKLKSIVLPDVLTEIGSAAFDNCNNLDSINIPAGVTVINESTFNWCNNLRSITLPNGVKSVGEFAFSSTLSLSTIDLGTGIESIGDNAFFQSGIVTISIPDSVTYIGEDAFVVCRELTSITVSENNTEYSSENGILFNKDKGTLIVYPANKEGDSYTIPSNVSVIGRSAFHENQNLVNITIPGTVKTIAESAFTYCKLTSLTIDNSITDIGEHSFILGSDQEAVTCDVYGCISGKLDAYSDRYTTFNYKSKIVSYDVNGGTGSVDSDLILGDYVLRNYDGTKDNCTFIGWTDGRSLLSPGSTVTISEDVTYCAVWQRDGQNTFMTNTSDGILITYKITKEPSETGNGAVTVLPVPTNAKGALTLPDSVEHDSKTYDVMELDMYAFYGCASLTSVHLPEKISIVPVLAFRGCLSLTSITVSEDNQSYTSVNGILFCGETIVKYPAGKIYTMFTLPDTATTIERYAFDGCTSLKIVTIPDNVTNISTMAFIDCSSLTTVNTGSGVSQMDGTSFMSCKSLKEINVSSDNQTFCSVNGIVYDKGMSKLIKYPNGRTDSTYTVPDTVTIIDNTALMECPSLKMIVVSENNTALSSKDGILFSKDGTKLIQYPAGRTNKSYAVPNTVTEIGIGAFRGSISLEQLMIPDTVTKVGSSMLYGCNSLNYLIVSDNLSEIGYYAFAMADYYNNVTCHVSGCAEGSLGPYSTKDTTFIYETLYVVTYDMNGGKGSTDFGITSGDYVLSKCNGNKESCYFIGWTDGSAIYSPGDTVTVTEDVTFFAVWEYYNGKTFTSDTAEGVTLTYRIVREPAGPLNGIVTLVTASDDISGSVTLPEHIIYESCTYDIVKINDKVFSGCKSITSIIIPSSITYIGDSAFKDCTSLISVTTLDSVTTIGSYAFQGCTSLTSISTSALTKLGINAFCGCTSLVTADLGDKLSEIVYYAFCNCSSLTSVKCDNATSVGSRAFYECSSLKTVGGTITSVGDGAFYNCSALTMGFSNVSYVSGNAFYKCSSISSITFSDDLEWIGSSAFYGCSLLTTVAIPENVDIGGSAFSYCTSLTDVTIGDGTKYVGSSAFAKCTSLRTVKIGTGTGSICNAAFQECTSLESVSIGEGFTSINYNAFYNCSSLKSITIPDSVTELGSYAFSRCTSLESVSIGEGLTSICNSAFSDCSSLKSITIPNSVTELGYSAFCRCTSLESVSMGEGLTSIGSYAFSDCSSLKSITIPNSVTELRSYAFCRCTSLENISLNCPISTILNETFYYCESLKSISIPDSVTKIDRNAFGHCSSLVSISIGNKVTSIGYAAFYYCTSLTSIVIPDSVTTIEKSAFEYCKSLETLSIGNGLTSIEDYSFRSLESLKTVTIGSNVTKIGNYAFYNCPAIESISIPDSVTSIGGSIFSNCKSLETVVLSKNITSIPEQAFYNCGSLTSIAIPDSVTTMGTYAFSYCKSLETVVLSKNITSIPKYAFYNCGSLTSIAIPDSVTTVGVYAFSHCSGATSLSIGSSVSSLGEGAFSYCYSLPDITVSEENETFTAENGVLFNTSMTHLIQYPLGNERTSYTIPDSVTAIETCAMNGCKFLTEILVSDNNTSFISSDGVLFDKDMKKLIKYPSGKTSTTYKIPDDVESIGVFGFFDNDHLETVDLNAINSIGKSAFLGCGSLKSMVIPSSVQSIEDYVFSGCTELTLIIIPDSVQSIGSHAFYNCDSLKSIDLPGSIQSIGYYAFSDCDSLESIVIPDSVQNIGDSVFENCDSLKSVVLSKNIQSIEYRTFYDCDSLESIIIPDSVQSIGSYAFSDCDSLESIVISGNVLTVYGYSFYHCDSLTTVVLCEGVSTINYKAFADCKSLKSVVIPSSMKTIDGAFYNCYSLTSIIFHAEDCKIYNNAFALGNKDNTVTCKVGGCAEGLLDKYGNEYTIFQYETLYTVSYDLNVASGENTSEEMFAGDYVIKDCTGTKTGYSFGGWSYSNSTYQPGDSITVSSDIAFKAIWNINQYTISFDSDGGSSVDSITQDYDTSVTAPVNPTKEGYTFVKWQLNGVDYAFSTMPAEDITLKAIWDVNQYTISFNSNGGSSVESITQDYGTEVDAPESPTRKGYTFFKWQLNGEDYAFSTMPAEDITLDAVWEALIYTITFQNGDYIISKTECAYDSIIVAPDVTPVKESTPQYEYTFSHWNGFTEGMTVTDDQTFDAVFTESTRIYVIKFVVDGQIKQYGEMEYGKTISAPIQDPEKESTEKYDFVFSHWEGYTKGMTVSEDRTFDAVFTKTLREYTVKFVYEGKVIDSKNLVYGSEIKAPQSPVKESTAQYDYTFSYWDGFTEGMTLSGDAEFDAVFSEKIRSYIVSFVCDGKTSKSDVMEYGTVIVKPADPVKTSTETYDYRFTKWIGYTEGMTVSGDVTFNGSFEAILKKIDTTAEKVVIDTKDVSNVVASKDVVDSIKNAGKEGKGTEITLSKGKIALDSASAAGLPEGTQTISLEEADRTKIPKAIVSEIGDRPVFSINIGDVHEFDGKLTISIAYELKEGENANKICIWYLKDDGSYERISCKYSDGYISFATTHLSNYAVMIEESAPEQNTDSSLNTGLIIGVTVAILAVVAVAAVLILKRH